MGIIVELKRATALHAAFTQVESTARGTLVLCTYQTALNAAVESKIAALDAAFAQAQSTVIDMLVHRTYQAALKAAVKTSGAAALNAAYA